jgi:hypothetical protein
MAEHLHDQYKGALFLPGHSHAEGLVRIEYDARNGTRSALTIPLLEAMLLLQQLEAIRVDAGIELPKDR